MYTNIILYIVTCIFSTAFSLNLTLTDYHDPVANHILDAEVINNILIISAMVQGIEFYDISDPQSLNHLTNFTLSSGGGWGNNAKSNCVRAINNYAYFTSNNGVYIVNISNPSNPQSLGAISGTTNLNLENLDINGNYLAICAHEDGVLLYEISNPINPVYLSTINTNNAWDVALLNNHIFIADNNKILIYNISNSENPIEINVIETTNAIKEIIIFNDLLFAAIGTNGVNIYNLESLHNPILLDNYNTTTLANKISAFDNNKIAVADWDDVEILEWNGESLNLVGYKNTGNRTMAIATKEKYIYSAEWASIQSFEFGQISGPDIDLSTWELNYPYVENDSSFVLFLDVINNGNDILTIFDNYTTNSEFIITNPLTDLIPGQNQTIAISYNASNENASGSYRIFSNDIDEPEIICETNGNINGANIGQPAIDFELNYVANGNGTFKLSEHLGNIIVLAFFAPN